jgi:hypothetical protein
VAIFGAFVEAARKYAREKQNAAADLSPVGAAPSE